MIFVRVSCCKRIINITNKIQMVKGKKMSVPFSKEIGRVKFGGAEVIFYEDQVEIRGAKYVVVDLPLSASEQADDKAPISIFRTILKTPLKGEGNRLSVGIATASCPTPVQLFSQLMVIPRRTPDGELLFSIEAMGNETMREGCEGNMVLDVIRAFEG